MRFRSHVCTHSVSTFLLFLHALLYVLFPLPYTLKLMAPRERVPCYCRKCKGAEVSKQERYRHGGRPQELGPVPSFNSWVAEHSSSATQKRSRSISVCFLYTYISFTAMATVFISPTFNEEIRNGPHNNTLDEEDNLDPENPEDMEQEFQRNDSPPDLEGEEHYDQDLPPLQQGVQEEDDPVEENADVLSNIESVRIPQQLIKEIKDATLENGNLDKDTIFHLRNPIEEPVDVSDPAIQLSIDFFLAVTNASQETYDAIQDAYLRHHLEESLLSYYCVKKLVTEITGVISVVDDMCVNSCLAFTGPFANDIICSICSEPRYDQQQFEESDGRDLIPQQQFHTILLGPQLQALR
ncbi:hypothetical protein BDQ17DRAFT_1549544 [Cyathus striatus]|nr:hypothetical protein BDQ17DRAFT_1549544 [Cyathus striatus]